MKNIVLKKTMKIGLIILFITASISQVLSAKNNNSNPEELNEGLSEEYFFVIPDQEIVDSNEEDCGCNKPTAINYNNYPNKFENIHLQPSNINNQNEKLYNGYIVQYNELPVLELQTELKKTNFKGNINIELSMLSTFEQLSVSSNTPSI